MALQATKLALVRGGIISDVPEPIAGFDLEECLPAEMFQMLVPVPGDAAVGWAEQADGSYLAPSAPALTHLAEILVNAATQSCQSVSDQVVPDATHQQAYQNAATIVWGSGGKAPTEEPAKSAFSAQAASLGLSVDTFANVVMGVSLASLQLAAILSTVRAGADSAKSTDDLKAVLTVFDASISELVISLNGAGLTVAVKSPAAIEIVGINK